ncbi:MAG: hypothetical protein HN353_02830 [Bdellovibrionales bacterium]|nr:hypothetical protein [Bdellovibrionales bacterium]MBT3527160.1 hypothetical protein [Bdellovibrionales bacterium]MBT7670390.1 hypothetical protein [Bdellovibrionales bacterium]MBT7765532.1 hypothetical protein [Bdellovibrionales bacterium]
MAAEVNVKFEKFEEYYGDIQQVKKIMDQCDHCGSPLVLSHLSDYNNLIVQESARCSECGGGNRKVVHILN